LRVDIRYEREGEAARGYAREELGGGGRPGASHVVGGRRRTTIAEERDLVNTIAMLLPAPPQARAGPGVLLITALAAATLAAVVFCHSIVAGCLAEDNLELGERPERWLSECTEGVEPGWLGRGVIVDDEEIG
jgi:hypothetical protein